MSTEAKILVIDDETSIRFSIQEALSRDGYAVTTAATGEAGVESVLTETFDLALIDLNLPGISGMEVLGKLKQHAPDTVVIILTAHASLETAVQALKQGAHDYLFKPCKTSELRESIRKGVAERQKVVRQKALLRQLEEQLSNSLANIRAIDPAEGEVGDSRSKEGVGQDDVDAPRERFLQFGSLIVDFFRHVITFDGQLLELSPTEFSLLAYLINEAPRVIHPQELVREVQGYNSDQWEASETVRYHVYRIRQKLKALNGDADVIHTVRGVGYTVKDLSAAA